MNVVGIANQASHPLCSVAPALWARGRYLTASLTTEIAEKSKLGYLDPYMHPQDR